MRLTIAILTFALFSLKIVSAQPGGGSLLFGGDVSFHTSSEEEAGEDVGSSNSFSIMPRGGIFLSDAFVVGLGVGYESTSNTSYSTSTTGDRIETVRTNNAFEIAPFARYYAEVSDNISFFIQGEFEYSSGTQTVEVDGDKQDFEPSSTGIGVNLSPGVTIFASNSLGVNFFMPGIISYESYTEEMNDDGDEYSETDLGFNFNTTAVGLGVDFFL